MSTRDDEALALFERTIQALTSVPKDIEIAVRKYAQACELLGWRQQANQAWDEISGYTMENVPQHRRVRAVKQWVPSYELGVYDRTHIAAMQVVGGGVTPPDEAVD